MLCKFAFRVVSTFVDVLLILILQIRKFAADVESQMAASNDYLMGTHGEGIESIRCARLSADSRAWTPLLYTVLVLGLVLITLSVVYVVHDSTMNFNRPIYNKYRSDAQSIIDYLAKGEGRGKAYRRLAQLTDKFGPRMTGSEALENSIDYLLNEMRIEGLEAHKEEASGLPFWVRGKEEAWLVTPRKKSLNILGLGSSIGTPDQGIEADVVVADSFEKLKLRGKKAVEGKIVVFNQPWRGYRESAIYRTKGASEAAKMGAVAVLIRSVASFSINSPHTGQQYYEEGVPQIPAACLTVEDANLLDRMQDRAEPIRIRLVMTSHPNGTVTSHNTVVEIKGATHPNEIVLISGHLDSWDVGEGAMDDGGGVVIAWQALSTLAALNIRPKRTIRAVFWTAEEQGLLGSKFYYNEHVGDGKNTNNETIVFVYESDAGAFKPYGLNFSGNVEATKIMTEVMQLLAPINASRLIPSDVNMGDVEYWRKDGVPAANLENVDRLDYYFQFHHSEGDTMETLTFEDLDYSCALTAVVAYVVADLDKPLPRDYITSGNKTIEIQV